MVTAIFLLTLLQIVQCTIQIFKDMNKEEE